MNDREMSAMIAHELAQAMTPEFLDILLRMRAQYGTEEAARRIAQYGAERISSNLATS